MNPLIISGLFKTGEQLLKRLFPDPEQQEKAQQELRKMEQEGDLKTLATRMSAIIAEANSEDPWTSRARPTFMYVFYLVILSLVLISPIVGVFYPEQMTLFYTNVGTGFRAIPEELWWLFGTGYLGYSGMRMSEKKARIRSDF